MTPGSTFRLLAALAWLALAADARAQAVAVIAPESGEPYSLALKGLRRGLDAAGGGIEVRTARVPAESAAEIERALGAFDEAPPDVLVTLGAPITAAAVARFPNLPIVAGMLLDRSVAGTGANVDVVILSFPVEVELRWLRRLLPDVRRVGVLYSPASSGARVEEAARAARQLGLEIVSQPVEDPRDLPSALKSLGRRIDALWAVPDPVVVAPATARSLLTFAYRQRIPFVGLSDAWTRAGALYSLDRDFTDVGGQCAEFALRALRGDPGAARRVEPPRKVVYSLNLKAARHLKLKLGDDVVARAVQVFP